MSALEGSLGSIGAKLVLGLLAGVAGWVLGAGEGYEALAAPRVGRVGGRLRVLAWYWGTGSGRNGRSRCAWVSFHVPVRILARLGRGKGAVSWMLSGPYALRLGLGCILGLRVAGVARWG